MIRLTIPQDSTIDYNLSTAWKLIRGNTYGPTAWRKFVQDSGEGILSVEFNEDGFEEPTIITFISEQYKTWYLLKWS